MEIYWSIHQRNTIAKRKKIFREAWAQNRERKFVENTPLADERQGEEAIVENSALLKITVKGVERRPCLKLWISNIRLIVAEAGMLITHLWAGFIFILGILGLRLGDSSAQQKGSLA